MRFVPIVLVLGALGCTSRNVHFMPAHAPGSSYSFKLADDDQHWGDAKVWAPRWVFVDHRIILLEFRIRLRNRSDQPLTLNGAGSSVELALHEKEAIAIPFPEEQAAPFTLDPGGAQQFRMTYPLPDDVNPAEVAEAKLSFAVETAAGPQALTALFLPLPPVHYVHGHSHAYWGVHYSTGYPYYHHSHSHGRSYRSGGGYRRR